MDKPRPRKGGANGEAGGSDSARPVRPASPRRVEAGRRMIEDPTRPTGLVLREVGYSPNTASSPRRNNLTPADCIPAALDVYGRALAAGESVPAKIKRIVERGLDRAAELIEDPDAPQSVLMPTVISLAKLHQDMPEDAAQQVTTADLMMANRRIRRLALKLARLMILRAARDGTDAALDALRAMHADTDARFPFMNATALRIPQPRRRED